MLAWASSSTLPSRLALAWRSSSWAVDQVAQHAVEGHGQLLELVAGVDVGPQRDVAAADGVAHVAEVPQRLDDHVADDGVGGDHRQEDGDDGGGQEDGPVLVDAAAGSARWGSSPWRRPSGRRPPVRRAGELPPATARPKPVASIPEPAQRRCVASREARRRLARIGWIVVVLAPVRDSSSILAVVRRGGLRRLVPSGTRSTDPQLELRPAATPSPRSGRTRSGPSASGCLRKLLQRARRTARSVLNDSGRVLRAIGDHGRVASSASYSSPSA